MQGYLGSVGSGEGLRVGDLVPGAGSVAVGVAARGALVVMETGAREEEGGWVELVRGGLVAGVCVLGVVFIEREFLLGLVPRGLVERFPVLRRFTNRK